MPNIRSITLDELDKLGIDDNNKLYWENRPLVIEETIHLQRWVNVAIVVGSVSTAILALIEVLRFCLYGT